MQFFVVMTSSRKSPKYSAYKIERSGLVAIDKLEAADFLKRVLCLATGDCRLWLRPKSAKNAISLCLGVAAMKTACLPFHQ